ncbi:MAG: DNA mismatch repair protein MutS [Planctomycetia bacterium]|nr:DNA mismatch repair protein MutS [Planctomycetia bacterium]
MDRKENNVTPMMRQYQEAKRAYPDALLLFRMGDFYEMFQEDAKTAARVLNLALTSREKGENAIPMAGFPYHQLESYLGKLISAGFRAAVCEQTEDPKKATGLVKREIVRVVTPGTLTDDALLDPRESNYLAAVAPREGNSTDDSTQLGVAWVDLSTGRFLAGAFPASRIVDELARISPSEVLLAEEPVGKNRRLPGSESPEAESVQKGSGIRLPSHLTERMMVTRRPDWVFSLTTANDALVHHFGAVSLEGYGFLKNSVEDRQAIRAAGAILDYLRETQRTSFDHIDRLTPYRISGTLEIDEASRRSLEITRTLREGRREGSLLSTLDQTITAMGSRLLAERVANPTTDRGEIERRQNAVAELLADREHSAELRELLRKVYDLERLLARVTTGRASPRDLSFLSKTLAVLPELSGRLISCGGDGGARTGSLAELEGRLDLCADLYELLNRSIVDDAPLSPRDGGFIREGFSGELDSLRELARGGKQWIATYQAQEVARTGIPNLKVGFNKVFGYYLEISHTHRDRVPPEYIRRQTVKNAERYITPALKEYEEQVLSADERSTELEYDLFLKVRDQILTSGRRIRQTAAVLAELDVFLSFAELARTQNYCRPWVVDEPVLKIVEGRHPVLDAVLPSGSFVPNDIEIRGRTISVSTSSSAGTSSEHVRSPEADRTSGSDSGNLSEDDSGSGDPVGVDASGTPEADPGQIHLITGPNMAGKSTYIRQVALLTLMAQTGSYIPAKEAKIGITDRIFARVGASDELSRGQSTFMVEMTETARILNTATPRSLVILDEIGRGTSTYDGISLAWAVVEQLHERIGARTLFATHYHELTTLPETLTLVRNRNVAVREWNDEVVFLHRIIPGAADRSYGIYVARLAGVPKEVVERAESILTQLEADHEHILERSFPPGKRGGDADSGNDVAGSDGDRVICRTDSGVRISQRSVSGGKDRRPFQLTFFELDEDPILEELDGVDLNTLSPIDALNLLSRWKSERPVRKPRRRR